MPCKADPLPVYAPERPTLSARLGAWPARHTVARHQVGIPPTGSCSTGALPTLAQADGNGSHRARRSLGGQREEPAAKPHKRSALAAGKPIKSGRGGHSWTGSDGAGHASPPREAEPQTRLSTPTSSPSPPAKSYPRQGFTPSSFPRTVSPSAHHHGSGPFHPHHEVRPHPAAAAGGGGAGGGDARRVGAGGGARQVCTRGDAGRGGRGGQAGRRCSDSGACWRGHLVAVQALPLLRGPT